MKKSYFILGLFSLSLVACINWQEEYKKKIAEAAEPIQAKFDFLEEMHGKIDKKGNCVFYYDEDQLSLLEAVLLNKFLPEGNVPQARHPEQFIVFHTPDSLGYHMSDDGFLTDDYSSYYRIVSDTVESKYELESHLSRFNSWIGEPLESAKFLLVVNDELLVNPKINYDRKPTYSFFTGYVFSGVKVYNLNTRQLTDSFKIAACNSNTVEASYITDQELFADLLKCLKHNVLSKAEERMDNK